MAKYNNGDDDGDNDENKDGNDDYNASAGSGSDGPIFYLIMTPRSCGGFSGGDGNGAVAAENYLYKCRTIYLPYKEHIKDVP